MLAQSLGEDVGAIVAADKVQIGDIGRPGCGLEAGKTRRSNGAGGEARVDIGVVGRIELQVVPAEIALIGPGQGQGVDDSGVCLQRHAPA